MKISSRLAELGARLADHPVAAAGELFVVTDPAAPSMVVLLVAILAGGSVMDASFFFSGGTEGSNMAYSAATRVKRSIYIAPWGAQRCPFWPWLCRASWRPHPRARGDICGLSLLRRLLPRVASRLSQLKRSATMLSGARVSMRFLCMTSCHT